MYKHWYSNSSTKILYWTKLNAANLPVHNTVLNIRVVPLHSSYTLLNVHAPYSSGFDGFVRYWSFVANISSYEVGIFSRNFPFYLFSPNLFTLK